MSDLLQSQDNQEAHVEQSSTQGQPSTFFEYNGRKFDAQEAIKKFEHADSYIEEAKRKQQELEERLERMQRELAKATKLEQAVEHLKSTSQGTQAGGHTSQPSASVDPEKLKADVMKAIQQEQQQATAKAQREQNLQKSHEAAVQKYGASYMDTLVKQAKERQLDLSDQDIIDLAARKPETFKHLFGLTQQAKPSAVPSGSSRVPSQQAQSSGKTWQEIAAEVAGELGIQYDKQMHNIPKAKGF